MVFQAHTNACPGSRAGLGFEKLSIDPMAALLSKGKEGHGGMAYKKTPDLAVSYLHSLPETVPSKYVIFQPLDKLSDAVVPAAVIFLVNADQLSALVTLANYDRPNQDNVKVLFGAGCVQAVLYSMCDTEACILGLTDPSARLPISKDLLSFSIPYARFLEMEDNVPESFLTGETWRQIQKRL